MASLLRIIRLQRHPREARFCHTWGSIWPCIYPRGVDITFLFRFFFFLSLCLPQPFSFWNDASFHFLSFWRRCRRSSRENPTWPVGRVFSPGLAAAVGLAQKKNIKSFSLQFFFAAGIKVRAFIRPNANSIYIPVMDTKPKGPVPVPNRKRDVGLIELRRKISACI